MKVKLIYPPGCEDLRNPDYATIYKYRVKRLLQIRQSPKLLASLRTYYKDNLIQYILDWGCTADPRNVVLKKPAIMPFILYPRQVEWLEWTLARWMKSEFGLTEKSRGVGVTWLAAALAVAICVFHRNLSIGFGSRKEEYVDRIGDPKSIFYKIRQFVSNTPVEFRAGWIEKDHSPHMRCIFPQNGSTIIGEAGDNIGRGDRAAIYFVDEAAFLPRAHLAEGSLIECTPCRIDISTANGATDVFALKRADAKIPVFTFHWRDDPRKDDEWYRQICLKTDPVVIAREYDINYSATTAGTLIPATWIDASIDAHIKLKITPTGLRNAGFDVGDQRDKNGWIGRHGILLELAKQWPGKESDIFTSVERGFTYCDDWGYDLVQYDTKGIGAGIKGDARVINLRRQLAGLAQIQFQAFDGAAGVREPSKCEHSERSNEEMFANFKAQSWWEIRRRFMATYRAVNGLDYSAEDIISISSKVEDLAQLKLELAQPTFTSNNAGKIVIDKQPDNTPSPNLADAAVIAFAKIKTFRGFFSVKRAI